MAENGSGYGYEHYGSHLSTDTEDALSHSDHGVSRKAPAKAPAQAAVTAPAPAPDDAHSRQASGQPPNERRNQVYTPSDLDSYYPDPADAATRAAVPDPTHDMAHPRQTLSQTRSDMHTVSDASTGAGGFTADSPMGSGGANSYYTTYADDNDARPALARGESGKPTVSGISMVSSGLSRGSFSDSGHSTHSVGATSIGPSVSEPGRAARLRTKGDLARLDQEGLGLAAAGQEQSSYYSDYEYYSDYYAQHAGNQGYADEEYPLVDVEVRHPPRNPNPIAHGHGPSLWPLLSGPFPLALALAPTPRPDPDPGPDPDPDPNPNPDLDSRQVRLNKPMGIVFEALQPEEVSRPVD